MSATPVTIFWFRRDLRLFDNHGLYKALSESGDVLPLFIFDKDILDGLPDDDARVTFIHTTLSQIKAELQVLGSDLIVEFGSPVEVWTALLNIYQIKAAYTNHDYDPYAIGRDQEIRDLLEVHDIPLHTYKDHVIWEGQEVLSKSDTVYTVFTPYKRRWLELWKEHYVKNAPKSGSFYPSEEYTSAFARTKKTALITLEEMSFTPSDLTIPDLEVPQRVIKKYEERRNYPGLDDSTSRLGIHFRFGTVSIRQKAMKAMHLSDTYLSELIWRDFYAQILANYPHVVSEAFRAKYDRIPWRENEEEFQLWCEGQTGYPIVDAGMRELNATGYMHNRVRMITASFLTKHLLMDWRRGEAYFALKLLDFDLASNNGGWQWASGSGTDAAPYFRIFNPTSQMEKFDKQRTYIQKWVPEYGTDAYPAPMVDHRYARERCLQTYKASLS